MLRKIVIAIALLAATPAYAEQVREPAGMDVRDEETGAVVGRVANVAHDAQGRVISADVRGPQAPADAPPYIMAPRPPASAAVVAVHEDDGFRIAGRGQRAGNALQLAR